MRILYLLLLLMVYIWGAMSHEKDLARNYQKYGDAKCWFYEIKR